MWIKISGAKVSIILQLQGQGAGPDYPIKIMSNGINLNELPPVENLLATRAQVEKDLKVLTESFGQLKGAQISFASSIQSLEALSNSGN